MLQAGGKQVSKVLFRRLTWRDLAYWQLHHWPDMATEPIRSHYKDQACAQPSEPSASELVWEELLLNA